MVWTLDAETILEPEHRFFTKTAVGNLYSTRGVTSYPLALFADLKISRLVVRQLVQGDIRLICVLINQHCMTVTECATPNILPAQSNIKSWSAQSNDIHHLSESKY